MKRISLLHALLSAALFSCAAPLCFAQGPVGSATLAAGFTHPPQSARPLVWWHWMNGNITQQGIQLDLDWMHSVGLGGFQTFDAALNTPQVVKERLIYMTPPWKAAFVDATKIANQYGMEEAIAGSPGWSESGGPWVPASHGMKKYVWSETRIDGGQPFTGKLAAPPSSTGAFQDEPIHDSLGSPQGAKTPPTYYADSVVIAYRQPSGDLDLDALHPTVTTSGGSPDLDLLTDGDLVHTTGIAIPAAGHSAWIQYAFDQPVTLRAITLVTEDPNRIVSMITGISAPSKSLEASDDGQTFHDVAKLDSDSAPETTVTFPATTARYFRVRFMRVPPPKPPAWASGIDPKSFGFALPPAPTEYKIAELVLHPGARVNHFVEKAAFVAVPDLYKYATPKQDADQAIAKSDVIDLTAKMQPDGTLNWTPPPGKWVVVRFGYSLLGITNHPATAEATGLEVDKLNHVYVQDYMEKYLDSYKNTVGADWMGKKGIRYIINDSWEAGSQNWTDDMIQQFRTRRGYDPTPWMPVLTGHIVQSAAASDQFLWDFRKTIADLIADEHYGQLEKTIHQWGMGHYGESHESGRAFVADGMEVKKFNEVPMGAMWTQTPGVNAVQYGYNADDRESASVAHIYGQNLAAAESMTAAAAPFAWYPAALKPTADQEFLNGINRIVVHESAHQPLLDKKPGLTLGPFGQWFNRNETWASQAGAWVTYLARTSYMLQQGHFGADLIYFYGEDSNLTAIFAHSSPNVPAGYGFDYVNADALIHVLGVRNGRITTPGGVTYSLLGLDPYSRHMSLPVLRAIHKLVEQGATVAGPKPIDDPSLADDHAEFRRLSDELFGDGTGVHPVGQGKVYAGSTPAQAFQAIDLTPDFDYSGDKSTTHLEFLHRKLSGADIYFVDNRSDNPADVTTSFRIVGRQPELWRADSGSVQRASFTTANGQISVPLHLEAWGTVFVVFRTPTTATRYTAPVSREAVLETLSGPWTVSFPPNWGAPSTITLPSLTSWSDSTEAGVKYFSGTGTYTRTVPIPASALGSGSHIFLDLGDVRNLATITVNGTALGVAWHAPYRMDITRALKPGSNSIAIAVTNAWVNRMIGDLQPGAAQYTFTDVKPYRANSPLLPSGLLGPVRLLTETRQ